MRDRIQQDHHEVLRVFLKLKIVRGVLNFDASKTGVILALLV